MFYYEEDYVMEVSEKAKNLLIARDKYLEAFFDWQDTCLNGFNDIQVELQTLGDIMETIEERLRAEKK